MSVGGKQKWTSGPWYVIKHPDAWSIQTKEGGDGECVASQYGDSSLANAKLIAKAPEMVEALKSLLEQFHAYENGWPGENVWKNRIGLPGDLQNAERILREAGAL